MIKIYCIWGIYTINHIHCVESSDFLNRMNTVSNNIGNILEPLNQISDFSVYSHDT